MKIRVISLGGSLIIPDKVDYNLLKKFKEVLRKNYSKNKFIVVCGGGSIARKYISALKKEGKSEEIQSTAGIRATRMNAKLLMQFFGKEANEILPINMKQIKFALRKNKVVFCGALRYAKKETTDGTAAKLANFFNTELINLSNVSGLYTSNPLKNKKAKFIPKISWKKFEKMALKIKYKPGQHFILDQKAAKYIKKNKTPTYLFGPNIENLNRFLNNKKYRGTKIEN